MSTKRPSSERATERVMRTPSTLALAIVAGLLAIAVGWLAAERGFGPFAQPKPPLPKIVTGAPPSLPKIVTGAPLTTTASSAEAISPSEITVIDGDTIRARGRTIRLVGFDAPESGLLARCPHERELAQRATAQLQSLVAGGSLELRMVLCACAPGTEGTQTCNYGRACGQLLAYGRDVGATMIQYRLARSYVCGATSCPARGSWC